MRISDIPEFIDILIVGGGITGAGILREATRLGLSALLVEQKDYAWGTSSKSSKLIHGGLRYLRDGHIMLTREAVIHRERLIREVSGLVSSLGFYIPIYEGLGPGRLTLEAGLTIYDIMSLKKQHQYVHADRLLKKVPGLNGVSLKGGFYFHDAQVDDARLVQRLINESMIAGGMACNYTRLEELVRDGQGMISGAVIRDVETGEARALNTRVVINATGVWAESIHPSPDSSFRLRPLRGSHVLFPRDLLPIPDAVTLIHPGDQRPLFVIPWESAVLFGTTDLDHKKGLDEEPAMTVEEAAYLKTALDHYFPYSGIRFTDALSTFAGIRPVLSKGDVPPSKESREHVVWVDRGLVTVTGGKLTTFRKLAWDALKTATPFLEKQIQINRQESLFIPIVKRPSSDFGLSADVWERLYGRYGGLANILVAEAPEGSLAEIPGTSFLWAELPFSARYDHIRHLTDLLFRRVRIGLLLKQGGRASMHRIESYLRPVLPWDDTRWEEEKERYFNEWKAYYSVPVV